MRLEFKTKAVDDLQYWIQQQPRMAKRLLKLIKECQRTPFSGTGKPEALKGNLSGWWSRRIDGEHRLVYRVEEDCLVILQARGHYD